MKKILVTGAAGFIGSHLVDDLLDHGHQVVGLDNLRNGKLENLAGANSNNNFSFIEGDILNQDTTDDAMSGIEVVFHLACLGVRHSIHSPYENHRVNAEGTLNVLESARNKGVAKFFYISTSEIYGKALSFPIKEVDPTYPLTVYGSSKLAGEHYTHSYNECYGLDTTVLRIFNNYGPRAHYEGDAGEIIPRCIVRILYGESPVIFGDGLITRDFFYVKDTARLLSSLIDNQKLKGLTINIGTGVEITMKKLVETLINLMPEYNTTIEYLDARPADVPRLWVDNSLMKELINPDQGITFEDGLDKTVSFYKSLSQHKNLNEEIELQNWKN